MPDLRNALTVSLLVAAAFPAPAAADGTTTSTRTVRQPPYYHGKAVAGPARTGHLPVRVVGALGIPEGWAPTASLEKLAAEINGWLDASERSAALSPPAATPAPSVYLGCSLDLADECDVDARENVLATTGGSRAWRASIAQAMADAGVDRLLALELRLAPMWIHQRNLKGSKEVALGTGFRQPLPWLTSLDTPVWVLLVSGSVIDAEGKVQRRGAEGIWALRTPFRASALRAQKLISPEDVEAVRSKLRRDDLPDSPLAWQAAVEELVRQLLG